MYYYGARYYDPRISIWASVDPLANYNPIMDDEFYIDGDHNGGVFNHFNHNSYGYCYQNPLRYIDPNGKQVDMNRGFNQAMALSMAKTPEEKIRVAENIRIANNASATGTLAGSAFWAGAYAVAIYGLRTIGIFVLNEVKDEALSKATGGASDVLDVSKLTFKLLKSSWKGLKKLNLPKEFKTVNVDGDFKVTIRGHKADKNAPKGTNSSEGPTYRVSRQSNLKDANDQGSGVEYYDPVNNQWHHESTLREFNGKGANKTPNPLYNAEAANNTHIPNK